METRSLRTQKRLEGERQSLILQREARAKQEQAAAQKAAEEAQKAAEAELEARQKLEDELYTLTLSAREQEELALMQKYDERIAIAGDDEGLIKAATDRLNADLAAVEEKYRKQGEEADKKENETKLAELQRYYDEAAKVLQEGEGQTRESELAGLQESYAERIALAESLGQDTLVLTEAQRQAELEINKKYDELEVEARKQRQQATLDVAKQSLDAIAAINQAFTGDSEEEQKKGFERSKKIQTAQALISTYESAVQAFKSLAGIPVVGPALGAGAAAAATAAGLANVKQIQSQQYQSAGGGGGGSSYSGAGTAGQAAQAAQQTPSAPVLDLGFLGAGSEQQVIETYVISENVTNAQQANKKIQDQATL